MPFRRVQKSGRNCECSQLSLGFVAPSFLCSSWPFSLLPRLRRHERSSEGQQPGPPPRTWLESVARIPNQVAAAKRSLRNFVRPLRFSSRRKPQETANLRARRVQTRYISGTFLVQSGSICPFLTGDQRAWRSSLGVHQRAAATGSGPSFPGFPPRDATERVRGPAAGTFVAGGVATFGPGNGLGANPPARQ